MLQVMRNIDIVAEKTVLDYLKEINFECVVLGEECGRVELSDNPKGYLIMDAIEYALLTIFFSDGIGRPIVRN